MPRSVALRGIHELRLRGPLGWVAAATFFHFASFYYLFSTLPLYVLERGGTAFQVGLVIGGLNMASLLARPLFGASMDRAGRRPYLLIGAAIYVVAALGYLVIPSISGLILWRLFHGLGLATFSTAAASLAGDLAPPRRRGATMGLYGLAQTGALAVGPGLGEILRRAAGHTGVFVATAVTALMAFVCGVRVPEVLLPQASRRGRAGWMGTRQGLRRGGVAASLQFAASIPYGTFLSFIAVVGRARGMGGVGLTFAAMAMSSAGVRMIAGRAFDARGPRAVVAPALMCVSSGMALLSVAAHPGLFLTAAILTGAGTGAAQTALLARVVEGFAVHERGRGVALFTASWELGAAGGAILMGRLAQEAGFSWMFTVAAILPLGALGALGLLIRGRGTG